MYRSDPVMQWACKAGRPAESIASVASPDLLSSWPLVQIPQAVEEIALLTSRRRYRCDVFVNTGGASGIAAPSWRGSDAPKCTPVPLLITACP